MQKIGEQIKIEKEGKDLTIEIYPILSKKEKLTLTFWLSAWTFCGLAVVWQLFYPYSSNQKIILVVYLGLWAYFEFKVLHAFRWQKSGKEVIELKNNKLIYTALIGKRGLPVEYEITDIKGFKYLESTETGFFNDIAKSTWLVGGEVIEFQVKDSLKRIGMKLNKKDASALVALLQKQL